MGEFALCVKALDGLPEPYMQIKAAASASQMNTIPRLTNILLSTERDEKHFSNEDKQGERDLDK